MGLFAFANRNYLVSSFGFRFRLFDVFRRVAFSNEMPRELCGSPQNRAVVQRAVWPSDDDAFNLDADQAHD